MGKKSQLRKGQGGGGSLSIVGSPVPFQAIVEGWPSGIVELWRRTTRRVAEGRGAGLLPLPADR